MAMHFDPSLIDSYTTDDLLIFLKKGKVTIEELKDIMGESDSFLQLCKRIEQFRRIKEEDDWKSVKYSSSDGIRKFLDKHPFSDYAYKAYDRMKILENEERNERCSLIKRPKICCRNCGDNEGGSVGFYPVKNCTYIPESVSNWFNRELSSFRTLCNSAVFAPAEISEGDDMLVQVYIYKDDETDRVVFDSVMSDKNATQRSYTPLNFQIKRGDRISVMLDMHGLSVDGETTKTIIWQNKFNKCCFFVYVPIDYPKRKVKGDVYISVNGLELGQMSFFSEKVEWPNDNICGEVFSKLYQKVFISYSHKDNDTAQVIAEAYKALGSVDFFYDRHSLSPGDLFEEKIYDFIDNSDLFLLCWSENAARSEWVKKERTRAYYAALNVPPRLRLYPINILPYSPPPAEMIGRFHFADYDKLIETTKE